MYKNIIWVPQKIQHCQFPIFLPKPFIMIYQKLANRRRQFILEAIAPISPKTVAVLDQSAPLKKPHMKFHVRLLTKHRDSAKKLHYAVAST